MLRVLAACMADQLPELRGKRVVLLLCGGNIDLNILDRVIGRGLVTDLRTDVGQFAQAGTPVMTIIAVHDLWINADMTENNLGNINPGDEAASPLSGSPGSLEAAVVGVASTHSSLTLR